MLSAPQEFFHDFIGNGPDRGMVAVHPQARKDVITAVHVRPIEVRRPRPEFNRSVWMNHPRQDDAVEIPQDAPPVFTQSVTGLSGPM